MITPTIRNRLTGTRTQLVLLVCAVLVSMRTALPLHAQDLTAPTPLAQVSQTAPPTLGLQPGQQILVASDKLAAPVQMASVDPGHMVLGGSLSHSKSIKFSDGYAGPIAAGLLLMPFDNSLEKSIPKGNDTATKMASSLGTPMTLLPVIGGLYLTGDKSTAKEALSALATETVLTQVMKTLAGRERPLVGDRKGAFKGPTIGGGHESFPSGHTAAAFAVASVLAAHHPDQKWLYYGLASAVGLARVRQSMHFPSDVLVGAGVGLYAGQQAVNHSHGMLSITF